jgi:hypothetical protein
VSKRKAPPQGPILPPPLAPTPESLALQAELNQRLEGLARTVTETNLFRVRTLVELALRGKAPPELVNHLSMIGRNYCELADNGPPKPSLRVIDGGEA